MSADKTPEVTGNLLTESAVLRRFLYDVSPCSKARHFADKMGLPGVSDEGHDMEHDDSHARLRLTASLDEPVVALIESMIKVHTCLLEELVKIDSGSPAQRKALMETFRVLVERSLLTGVPAILATLLDLGYISVERSSS